VGVVIVVVVVGIAITIAAIAVVVAAAVGIDSFERSARIERVAQRSNPRRPLVVVARSEVKHAFV
jgi:hypothetical protein